MRLLTWHLGPASLGPCRSPTGAVSAMFFFLRSVSFFQGRNKISIDTSGGRWSNSHVFGLSRMSLPDHVLGLASSTFSLLELVGQPFGIWNLSINQVQLLSLIIMLKSKCAFFCSLRHYDYNWLLKHVFFFEYWHCSVTPFFQNSDFCLEVLTVHQHVVAVVGSGRPTRPW